MQWSKLKYEIEGKFADRIKGRIELFSTRYNKPYSNNGRGWITLDGREIVNFATIKSMRNYGAYYHETTQTTCLKHRSVMNEERVTTKLIEEGEFSRFDLHNCCWEYLSLNIEDALQHKSPIINFLAILDKRLGKRRLIKINDTGVPPLVAYALNFRLEVEGIKTIES